jgi:hypothetical protein
MTPTTRHARKLARIHGAVALGWALITAPTCLADHAVDLEVEKVELRGRLTRVAAGRAGSPVVSSYKQSSPSAPREVDVVVKTFGSGATTAVLDVIPVVGMLNLDKRGAIDLGLIGGSLTTLPSFYRVEQPASFPLGIGDRPQTFTFAAVPVEEIIDEFTRRHVWPRRLIFRVGLLPVPGEPSIANNVAEFELTVEPADS